MFPMGARRRIESDAASVDATARPGDTRRPAEVVWVHEGPLRVTIVDEPRRGFHDHTCRCEGCQASRQADLASDFLR